MTLFPDIRSRLEKATPGPWGIEKTSHTNWIGPLRTDGKCDSVIVDIEREGLKPEALKRNDANAALIAQSPTDIARLLAALDLAVEALEVFADSYSPVSTPARSYLERLKELEVDK